MEKKTIELTGKASPEQIATWKEKYGDVHEIEIAGHACYVRGFDRKTMSYALSQMSFAVNTADNNKVEMNMGRLFAIGEAGLTNLWLGGSAEIKNQTRLYTGAALLVGELFDYAEGTIKKL